jgi:hypothetical protein
MVVGMARGVDHLQVEFADLEAGSVEKPDFGFEPRPGPVSDRGHAEIVVPAGWRAERGRSGCG